MCFRGYRTGASCTLALTWTRRVMWYRALFKHARLDASLVDTLTSVLVRSFGSEAD